MTVIERMEDVDMDDNSSSVGRLEEEAKRRKERLQQMRRTAEGGSDAPSSSSPSTVEGVHHLPAPIFRNYKPTDESLKELSLPKSLPESLDETMKQEDQDNIGSMHQSLESIDLENLAPKKVDWDLKRIIQKSLDKLERRTLRSIAELILEKIQAELKQDQSISDD